MAWFARKDFGDKCIPSADGSIDCTFYEKIGNEKFAIDDQIKVQIDPSSCKASFPEGYNLLDKNKPRAKAIIREIEEGCKQQKI